MKKFLVAIVFSVLIGVTHAEEFQVRLSTTVLSAGPQDVFQVRLSTSLPIQKIEKGFLEIENGLLLNLTKISNNLFLFTVKSVGTQGSIKIRVKPGYIISTTGLKNSTASNVIEVTFKNVPFFSSVLGGLNNFGQVPKPTVNQPVLPTTLVSNKNNSQSQGSFGSLGSLLSSLLSKSSFGGNSSNKPASANPPYQANTYQVPQQASQISASQSTTSKQEEVIPKKLDNTANTTLESTNDIIFAKSCPNLKEQAEGKTTSTIKYGRISRIIFIDQLSETKNANSFKTEDVPGVACSKKTNLVSVIISRSNKNDSFIVLIDRSLNSSLTTSSVNSCTIFPENSLIKINTVTGYYSSSCVKGIILGMNNWEKVNVSKFSEGMPVYILKPGLKINFK